MSTGKLSLPESSFVVLIVKKVPSTLHQHRSFIGISFIIVTRLVTVDVKSGDRQVITTDHDQVIIWHIIKLHLAHHQVTSGTSEHIWHIGTHLAHRRIHLAHLGAFADKTSASYHYRWAHSFVFIKDIIEFAIRGSVTAV